MSIRCEYSQTFTEDLQKMAKWLVSCGITTAAMESTGVYWIPLYDVLEQHGVKPCLVNARGKRAGAAQRLAGMPVAAVSAFGRTAARGISAGGGYLRGA